jgi:hypothetical protein
MSLVRNGRYFLAANKAFNRCGISFVKNCSTNFVKSDQLNPKKESFRFPRPEPDLAFLLSPQNRSAIVNNLVARLEIHPEEAEQKLNELSNLSQVTNNNSK